MADLRKLDETSFFEFPQEIDELCDEWQPEPLEGEGVPPARQNLQPPVISDDVGTHVTADGRRVLNLASTNFLGIAGDPDIRVRRRLSRLCPTGRPGSCCQCTRCGHGETHIQGRIKYAAAESDADMIAA